jgi:uncharacterized SAM-binding protein YcdF (DUF218 family)
MKAIVCPRTAIASAVAVLAVLGLCATTPLAYVVTLPLREPAAPRKGDVIVLLSSGQIDGDWLTPDGTQRTLGALKLYREQYAPAIVSSGSNLARGADQASLQARCLVTAGVPPQDIVTERKSSRTYESLVEVRRLMRERGWNSAVIVTSELDVLRIRLVARKLGMDVSFLAVPEFRPPRSPLYFPAGVGVLYHGLYEYAGLLLYKLRGWC